MNAKSELTRGENPPDQTAWNAFTPHQVFARLQDVSLPWAVAGGWALDLWRGHVTRDHDDLEITVLRPDFDAFRSCFPECDIWTAHAGEIAALDGPPPDNITQYWCHDREMGAFKLDIMIERGTPRRWVYKRNKRITRPRPEANGRTADGIPYLNPACVLLFKAKAQRDKDQADFFATAPDLSDIDRAWLRDALTLAHPDHAWIGLL